MKLTRRDFLKSIAFTMAGFAITGFKKPEPEIATVIPDSDEVIHWHTQVQPLTDEDYVDTERTGTATASTSERGDWFFDNYQGIKMSADEWKDYTIFGLPVVEVDDLGGSVDDIVLGTWGKEV